MREQLKLLEELQKHDLKIQELDGLIKSVPARLDEMRADLQRIEALVAHEKEELEETERWRREQEQELKNDEQQLAKVKAKAGLVKTSKEYMASQRELETTRKLTEEAQEKLAKVVEAADAARTRITAHERDVAELRKVVEAEAEQAQGRLSGVEQELAAARAERQKLSAGIKADLLRKYNTILKKRSQAVVAVHDGTCLGCSMNIPPQLFNTLHRGNSLELCPNCNRIIYWDKLLEDPDGKPAEKPEPENPPA